MVGVLGIEKLLICNMHRWQSPPSDRLMQPTDDLKRCWQNVRRDDAESANVAASTNDQADDEQNQEHDEQDLRNRRCSTSDAGKAKYPSE